MENQDIFAVDVIEHPLDLNSVAMEPQNFSKPEIQDFLISELFPNVSEFDKDRIRHFLSTVAKNIQERLDAGETLRNDWYGKQPVNPNSDTYLPQVYLLRTALNSILTGTHS